MATADIDVDTTDFPVTAITAPGVYVLARQHLQTAELDRFLADHGVSWQTDSTVAAEVVTETAGRTCFDDQTEILTDRGWKLFADLDRTESVMTLRPADGRAEWQTPADYQVLDYDGPLVCADGRDVSFAVTPDHRLFGTFSPARPTVDRRFVRAADLAGRTFRVPSAAAGWIGTFPRAVKLPALAVTQRVANQFGRDFGTATSTLPAARIAGRRKLRALAGLMTYYAAEGSPCDSAGAGRGLIIYGHHVREVTRLCDELGLKWSTYTDPRNGVPRVRVAGGRRWLELFTRATGRGAVNKRLPRWVLELPTDELREVWDILVRTDGHVYPSGREVLVTTSPTLAGQAQEILLKIGASSACRRMSGGKNHQVYMVSRKAGRPIHLNDKVAVTERPYTGKVYCVSTANGVVYVRRNGVVHFSGNCYMSFAKPRPGGNAAYLGHIKEVGHGSVLEHAGWTFLITGVSRSLTHELVRHRAGFSYSQLSQRYVDESVAEYVEPAVIAADPELHAVWLDAVRHAHAAYVTLADKLNAKLASDPAAAGTGQESRTARRKAARQAARSVLPNATETKITVTANARALRHFLESRGSVHAEPEIRQLANALLDILVVEAPNLFADYRKVPLPDGTFDLQTDHPKV